MGGSLVSLVLTNKATSQRCEREFTAEKTHGRKIAEEVCCVFTNTAMVGQPCFHKPATGHELLAGSANFWLNARRS
jgi:hypothetical protein